jgi:uncharacterized membrane protein
MLRLDDAAPWPLVLMFAVAGVLHFVVPGTYERIVPRWLPAPRLLVYLSGAAELAGAAGLLVPALRPAAGWGLILLLAAVFPANVQMLRDARASARTPAWARALLWARLPLQPLLMWWVWAVAVRGR